MFAVRLSHSNIESHSNLAYNKQNFGEQVSICASFGEMQLTFHHVNLALFHLLLIHLKDNLTKTSKGHPTVKAAEEIYKGK